MKTLVIILALVIGFSILAETNAPPANSLVSVSKVEATIAKFEWERIDMEVYLPNGMEKKQIVEVYKRCVVTCYDQGEMVVATNTTSKIIIRTVPINVRKTSGEDAIPPMPPP